MHRYARIEAWLEFGAFGTVIEAFFPVCGATSIRLPIALLRGGFGEVIMYQIRLLGALAEAGRRAS